MADTIEPFNRTIRELKHVKSRGDTSRDCPFNRTIRELKHLHPDLIRELIDF